MTPATEARQLLSQGRLAEAERAFERVLEGAPDNLEALNVVALACLHNGRVARALELLNRAAQVDPRDPVTRHHLGRANEATGNVAAAAEAHGTAVRLAPEFYVARLHLASTLERLGSNEAAVLQYARALQDAQQQGHWLNAATTPMSMKPLVERALQVVRTGRRAALARLLEPLVQRYGRSSLTRVERCVRIYLNEEWPVYPDPRQQPTFLFFPGLPASPYLDRALLPWVEGLEAQTSAIQHELSRLLPSSAGRERVFTSEELEQQNLRGLDVPPSWNGYYFYRYGDRRADNCTSCPVTAQAIETLPLARVREHAPEVLFSVFTPGTHLLPHRGVTNTRLVGHLPLIIPPSCALSVGGEIHEWREGRVVVFDDTYEHEAWNRSDSTRVVMIFDIWNPYLTELERAAVADLIGAIGDFRRAVEDRAEP